MKKILFFAVMCLTIVSCNSEKNELYEHTDYGLLGGGFGGGNFGGGGSGLRW